MVTVNIELRTVANVRLDSADGKSRMTCGAGDFGSGSRTSRQPRRLFRIAGFRNRITLIPLLITPRKYPPPSRQPVLVRTIEKLYPLLVNTTSPDVSIERSMWITILSSKEETKLVVGNRRLNNRRPLSDQTERRMKNVIRRNKLGDYNFTFHV